MSYQQLQNQWKLFSEIIENSAAKNDQVRERIIKQCLEQNIAILNNVFALSIEQVQKLQEIPSVNELICTQAKLTHEVSKKLSLLGQRFLSASLNNISDYNEWLKAHCALATDSS